MQGQRPPSFLCTKKNPAKVGDVDGRMKPSMYRFSWLRIQVVRVGMSYGRCGGSLKARDLLKATDKSLYSSGRLTMEVETFTVMVRRDSGETVLIPFGNLTFPPGDMGIVSTKPG